MPCSTSSYVSNLAGGTVEAQMAKSHGGLLDVVSPEYKPQMQYGQFGGKGRRTRKHIRRRSTKHKKRSHGKKSHKMIRRRK